MTEDQTMQPTTDEADMKGRSLTPPPGGDPAWTATDATDAPDAPDDGVTRDDPMAEGSSPDDQPDAFPREYVEKLRRENAEARAKAKHTDELAREVFTLRVAATGRLADPTDLPYVEGLTEPQELSEAIDTLLASKPHLAARRPRGSIGQGATGASGTVNLADMLRARA